MELDHRNAGDLKGVSAAQEAPAAFDCNVCLDFACDPVVTFCGHLYCWPCLYKWSHAARAPSDDPLRCPVCKAELELSSVIPIYGSGKAPAETKPLSSFRVPPRPPACPTSQRRHPCPRAHHRADTESNTMAGPAGEMFGKLVYAMVFGGRYRAYPNSFSPIGENGGRRSREEILADVSLNIISIFLFWCLFVCFLFF